MSGWPLIDLDQALGDAASCIAGAIELCGDPEGLDGGCAASWPRLKRRCQRSRVLA